MEAYQKGLVQNGIFCQKSYRTETWITPNQRSAIRGKPVPPTRNYVVVQPATGLRREQYLLTPRCAALTRGYPPVSPAGPEQHFTHKKRQTSFLPHPITKQPL